MKEKWSNFSEGFKERWADFSDDVKVKSKNGWNRFKNSSKKVMPTLSKLSKAFLLPIALLPIAGVFLGVGAAISTNTTEFSGIWYVGNVMNMMGDVVFGNLPILFTMSVAMAYSKDSGVAALTAVIGFLVMNGMQAALLTQNDDGTWSMLFHNKIPDGLINQNLGVTSLNTGVFAGIFVGAIAAWSYNRFHKTQLPQAISFFSGTKLVPIINFVLVLPLSLIFMIFWPWIGRGLEWFGVNSGNLPTGLDSFVYEIFERSLVPFGLHHVFYSPLWWTSAGGSISGSLEAANDAFLAGQESYKNVVFATWESSQGFIWTDFYNAVKFGLDDQGVPLVSGETTNLYLALGDQTMMYAVNANLRVANYTDFQDIGMNLGRFQSGKYGFMLLGLPAAAVAMWLTVPKANRKNAMGIYFSAAFTCFLTGITEPLEFTFLFLAPWMFYGIHMPLASLAFFGAGFLHTHVSMTVSGGFIDYLVFGIIPFASGAMSAMSCFGVLIVAVIIAPCYFVSFYYAVKWKDVKLPGREGDSGSDVKLFTKEDYKASKGQDRDGNPLASKQNGYTDSKDPKEIARFEKAARIIEFLGGQENILDVDSCASRLRLTVKDPSKVNKDGIMSLGGSTGMVVRDNNVQVVYGGEQEAIKPRMIEILKIQRREAKANNSSASTGTIAPKAKAETKKPTAKKTTTKK